MKFFKGYLTWLLWFWAICMPIILASFGIAVWLEFIDYPKWLIIPMRTIATCGIIGAGIQCLYILIYVAKKFKWG